MLERLYVKGNSYTLLGLVNYSYWRKQYGNFSKNQSQTFHLAMPLLGHGNSYTSMFIATLFIIVRKWDQPRNLSKDSCTLGILRALVKLPHYDNMWHPLLGFLVPSIKACKNRPKGKLKDDFLRIGMENCRVDNCKSHHLSQRRGRWKRARENGMLFELGKSPWKPATWWTSSYVAKRWGLKYRKPLEPEKVYLGHGQHTRESKKIYTFLN